ncbi:MAG TPA: DinB family protein [Candidatus Acidoferrum sp.]|nr:DinB family protein [Candidatus Acidoferrum sp.]
MSSPTAQTNSERENLLQLLRRTESLYLATLEGVSPAQAGFRPAPERWCILEIAEHVATTEEFMSRFTVTASPSTEETDLSMDQKIHRFAADRGRRFSAPDGTRPCGRFGSLAEAVATFRNALQKTIEHLEQTSSDLRRSRVMHPAAGNIDVHQNLLIMAYHPERHAKQIEEIKTSEGYPK